MESTRLLSVTEAAKRLGVTRQRMHTLIVNEQLRAIRLGRYHYVEETEIERYMSLPRGKPYAPRSTHIGHSVDKSQ